MSEDSEYELSQAAGTNTRLNRRGFLGLVGATAGAAVVGGIGSAAAAAPDPRVDATRAASTRRSRRPNFLIVMVDEMRFAPVYETAALQQWRQENLPNINSLRKHGMDFQNHYIQSTACQPSRTSIFTGQYPTLHGVSQTNGAAKSALEEDMYSLDPTTVPTIAGWLGHAGYDCVYKGKWHISEEDLFIPGGHTVLPSYNDVGVPSQKLVKIYEDAERLANYGFSGWIGPEPHGTNPLNSGSSGPNGRGRDEYYAKIGAQEVRRLRNVDKPWFLVTSFVNPHDITLWGNLTLAMQSFYLQQQLNGSSVPHDLFDSRFDASLNESLSTKPSAQASYQGVYPKAFQPTDNNTPYQRFYMQLQANVDVQIGKVLKAVRESDKAFQRDTIVIFLSDHGELLGSHGGLHQKWHCYYEEMAHVPFIVYNPSMFPNPKTTDVITSHADLLPTMLGLAGVNTKSVLKKLQQTHTQARMPVGRDLTPLLTGAKPASHYAKDVAYFHTDDMVTRTFSGVGNLNAAGVMYAPVIQPSSVESVVTFLPTGAGGAPQKWKYNRYFDNPALWSSPNVQDVLVITEGVFASAGTKATNVTVKTTPLPDEIEVYNVTADPTEMNNLAGNSAYSSTINQLATLLTAQSKQKALEPIIPPQFNGAVPTYGVGV